MKAMALWCSTLALGALGVVSWLVDSAPLPSLVALSSDAEEQRTLGGPKPVSVPEAVHRESVADSQDLVVGSAESMPEPGVGEPVLPANATDAASASLAERTRSSLVEAGLTEAEVADCLVAWERIDCLSGGRAFANLMPELGALIQAGHVRVARIKNDRPGPTVPGLGIVVWASRRLYENRIRRRDEDLVFTVVDVPATSALWSNLKLD